RPWHGRSPGVWAFRRPLATAEGAGEPGGPARRALTCDTGKHAAVQAVLPAGQPAPVTRRQTAGLCTPRLTADLCTLGRRARRLARSSNHPRCADTAGFPAGTTAISNIVRAIKLRLPQEIPSACGHRAFP